MLSFTLFFYLQRKTLSAYPIYSFTFDVYFSVLFIFLLIFVQAESFF